MDMCKDMDMCIDMRTGMCMDMCLDMCAGMLVMGCNKSRHWDLENFGVSTVF